MIDIFLRAETPGALRAVVKSAPFRNIIGDLRDARDASVLKRIAGAVDHVYFRPGSVVVTPGTYDAAGNEVTAPVTDAWCWLHLRLSGPAEASDDDPAGTTGADRWARSRLIRWMKDNGASRIIRQTRVWQHTLGNGKRVQVWRGSEMEANGILFHEFQGGNSY